MKLDGFNLDSQELVKLVRGEEEISLAGKAIDKMRVSRKLVLEMIDSPHPIYGLNTGLGKNKDRRISKDELALFNQQLIYAHCVGLEPYFPSEIVRAAMVIKLNSLLKGYAGAQVEMAYLLRDLFNKGISPQVCSRGSVGQGDIGLMAYIGLTLMGQGKVEYQGQILAADQVFKENNIKALKFYAKDGLAIISSNALSLGRLAFIRNRLQNVVEHFDSVYALSLEAFYGHVSPLDGKVVDKKQIKGQQYSAARIGKKLENSYLFTERREEVQDPLSFRNAALIHGAVYDSLDYVRGLLDKELLSSDDNPMVDIEGQRIISTPHYDSLHLTLATEMLARSCVHMVQASIQRMLRLSERSLTSLPRFLADDDNSFFGLQTLQKTLSSLQTHFITLAQPVSHYSLPVSGNIEDISTQFPKILDQLEEMGDKLDEVLSLEIFHAYQALKLRFTAPMDHLGNSSRHLYGQLLMLNVESCQLISEKVERVKHHLAQIFK